MDSEDDVFRTMEGDKHIPEQTYVVMDYMMRPTRLNVSGYSTIGGRKTNEDRMVVTEIRGSDGITQCILFGIYDGHGGTEPADYAVKRLHRAILDKPGFHSTSNETILNSIGEAFVEVHEEMRERRATWSRKYVECESTAGTTASVAIIYRGKIFVSHVGDSRIVLGYMNSDGGEARWRHEDLTEDHKPQDEREQSRIYRSGGSLDYGTKGDIRVVWERSIPGDGLLTRKFPFLNMTRSLADFWSYNPITKDYVVSPNPDGECVRLDSMCKCLILASDGVWGVMDSSVPVRLSEAYKEICDYQTKDCGAERNPSPSELVCKMALQRWSRRADNITVIVVLINPDESPPQIELPVQIPLATLVRNPLTHPLDPGYTQSRPLSPDINPRRKQPPPRKVVSMQPKAISSDINGTTRFDESDSGISVGSGMSFLNASAVNAPQKPRRPPSPDINPDYLVPFRKNIWQLASSAASATSASSESTVKGMVRAKRTYSPDINPCYKATPRRKRIVRRNAMKTIFPSVVSPVKGPLTRSKVRSPDINPNHNFTTRQLAAFSRKLASDSDIYGTNGSAIPKRPPSPDINPDYLSHWLQ